MGPNPVLYTVSLYSPSLYYNQDKNVNGSLFFKKFHGFFANKKLKKPPSKVAQKNSNPLFFLFLGCPKTKEFMFQNVAFRTTVYRTGDEVVNHMAVEN
jgi:hypothetical protein